MNAPLAASLLATVGLAPKDPILGVTETYNADTNPKKVNLGVGVYCDDSGKVPLLECVKRAEREMIDKAAPRGYLPIDGLPAYDKAVKSLLFGADNDVVTSGRVVTVQGLGGTGALKVGADFLRRFAPGAKLLISDPSWENHRALFEAAGFAVDTYPYYASATHGLDFDGMLSALEAARQRARSSCCTPAATTPPVSIQRSRSGIESSRWCALAASSPFVDFAYQGFADGLAAGTDWSCAASPQRPVRSSGVELVVLQVLLIVRRAHRLIVHRRRGQG